MAGRMFACPDGRWLEWLVGCLFARMVGAWYGMSGQMFAAHVNETQAEGMALWAWWIA